MEHFWYFAREMLRYKRLITLSLSAALLDAMCAFGGFGSLMWVIDTLLGKQQSLRDAVATVVERPGVQRWFGDPKPLLALLPENRFVGFACLLGVILILTMIGTVFRFLYQYWAFTVSFRAVTQIRKSVFHRLVHVSLATMSTGNTADMLSRLVRDSARLARGFNTILGKAVRNVLIGMVCLIIALLVDKALTGIFLLGLLPIAILLRKFGKRVRRATRSAMAGYGKMTGALQESLQASRIVKLHQAEGYERRRFNTINRHVLAAELKARTARALSAPVVELLAITGVIAVALTAGWYIFEFGEDPENLVKVVMMLGAAGASFRPLANLNNDLHEAAAGAARIRELLYLPLEPNTREHATQPVLRLPRHERSVRFEGVGFTYPTTDRPALHDVNLVVEHELVCAIVGANGSGKSTLLGLLPRLYEPDKGRILIDGIDIATCSLRSVRRQLAVVTQETVLFDGTIADNLTYGRGDIGRQRLIDAAHRAHADSFIRELPQGYDTPIGEWGSRLSGGQRQRIALARAILRDPAILILDEATSQIDAESEAQINESLRGFRQGRTTFVIAHRLSTVINADLIVVMLDGTIVDQGKHAQLLERCKTYRTLTRTQFLPEAG